MTPAGNGHPGRRVQYAALPYRVRADDTVEVRLITSRETRRWVLPKGWPIKGMSPARAAARETYEEAGLIGAVAREAIGMYTYEKRIGLRSILCDVLVFPLKVKRHLRKWPERSQRVGFWFTVESAAAAVQEPELSALILSFGDQMARKLAEKAAARSKAGRDAREGGAPGAPARDTEDTGKSGSSGAAGAAGKKGKSGKEGGNAPASAEPGKSEPGKSKPRDAASGNPASPDPAPADPPPDAPAPEGKVVKLTTKSAKGS